MICRYCEEPVATGDHASCHEQAAVERTATLAIHTWALLKKVGAVQAAIIDEGPVPEHHRAVMERHRKEWPTLWAALDELVK